VEFTSILIKEGSVLATAQNTSTLNARPANSSVNSAGVEIHLHPNQADDENSRRTNLLGDLPCAPSAQGGLLLKQNPIAQSHRISSIPLLGVVPIVGQPISRVLHSPFLGRAVKVQLVQCVRANFTFTLMKEGSVLATQQTFNSNANSSNQNPSTRLWRTQDLASSISDSQYVQFY